MKQIKKNSFSMIEVLVTLMLFSILIAFLSFWKINLSHQFFNNKRIINFFLEEDIAYRKMNLIFDQRDRVNTPILFDKNSCSLFFNRGLTFCSELSGMIQASFEYSIIDKTIYLVISKILNDEKEIKERIILLDGVNKFEWEFVEDPFKITGGNFLGLKMNLERTSIDGFPNRKLTYVF